jgi:hypothetical protein
MTTEIQTPEVPKETITVDGQEYVIADLPKEVQLKIRQYVICQQRSQELTDAFNKTYDEFMTEKSILDSASAQYANEISVAVKSVEIKTTE